MVNGPNPYIITAGGWRKIVPLSNLIPKLQGHSVNLVHNWNSVTVSISSLFDLTDLESTNCSARVDEPDLLIYASKHNGCQKRCCGRFTRCNCEQWLRIAHDYR